MLLTINDVSTWLNIKTATLYHWAAQGKIPCRRIHGLIRFEREAITAWLRSFEAHRSGSVPMCARPPAYNLEGLIEAAKRHAYTPRHGETRPKSGLIGKEEEDGAV
jgi:excisionase family DNA binding protein